MSYFQLVLQQIGAFVVYAAIGVLAIKGHVIDRGGLNVLSRLITRIVLPLLIYTNTANGATREEFYASLSILVIAAVLYLLMFLISFCLSRRGALNPDIRKVYQACVMFGNCGFMGIPVVTALFPERGGMYIAIYSIVDQLVLWSVGVQILSGDAASGRDRIVQFVRKTVNPATVAILAGVFVLLTGIRLPDWINTALTRTGAAATPLAMIYLGGMFCYIQIREYLLRPELYRMIAVKMLALPVLCYLILSHIPVVSSEIAITISIVCALPTMSSVAMIAESVHADSVYASGMIFATTVWSAVTLPIVCLIF